MKKILMLLFICFVFAEEIEKDYPVAMIFSILKDTVNELNIINSVDAVSKKYNIPIPVPKAILLPQEIAKELNDQVEEMIIKKYGFFDLDKATIEAETKFKIYKKEAFVSFNYRLANGKIKVIQGFYKGLNGQKAIIGDKTYFLESFESTIQDTLIPGKNQVARKNYIIKKQFEYNNKRNTEALAIRKKLSNNFYSKYNYIYFEKKWWAGEELLLFCKERENILRWDEVYTKIANKIGKNFGYKYENGKFVFLGFKLEVKKTVYFDADF